jgi:predicted Fe-Mo cluster-binding NifX family protein
MFVIVKPRDVIRSAYLTAEESEEDLHPTHGDEGPRSAVAGHRRAPFLTLVDTESGEVSPTTPRTGRVTGAHRSLEDRGVEAILCPGRRAVAALEEAGIASS